MEHLLEVSHGGGGRERLGPRYIGLAFRSTVQYRSHVGILSAEELLERISIDCMQCNYVSPTARMVWSDRYAGHVTSEGLMSDHIWALQIRWWRLV